MIEEDHSLLSASQKPYGIGPLSASDNIDSIEDDEDEWQGVTWQNLGRRVRAYKFLEALVTTLRRMVSVFRRDEKASARASSVRSPRPTIWQQATRSLLYVLEFAIAYLIMLMVMYMNGYLMISVLLGAFLGFFVFEWGSFDR